MNSKLIDRMERLSPAALYKELYTDPLTGTHNRQAFTQASYNTVVIADMDSLKFLNDNYGHRVGDEYLCKMANALVAECGVDNVYRLSAGDEFAITFSDHQTAKRCMSNCLAGFPGMSYGIGSTMTEADTEMYADKEAREKCGYRVGRGECPPWALPNPEFAVA